MNETHCLLISAGLRPHHHQPLELHPWSCGRWRGVASLPAKNKGVWPTFRAKHVYTVYLYLKPWGFGISRWSIQKSTKRTHDSPLRSSGSSFGEKNQEQFHISAWSFSSWWFQPSQNGFIFSKKRWNKKTWNHQLFLKKDFNFWNLKPFSGLFWKVQCFLWEITRGARPAPLFWKGRFYRKMIYFWLDFC